LACELCGQPAARQNPTLCAECYYRYWYWQKATMPVAEQETPHDRKRTYLMPKKREKQETAESTQLLDMYES